MAIKIEDRFSSQCAVVSNNSYDTCGTITRSSIDYLTPAQLEDLFAPGGVYADLEAFFKTAIEMKACGTRTYGLYDWIMSGADRTKGKTLLSIQRAQQGPSTLFPFIMAKQDSVLNTDFWVISAGYTFAGYNAGVTGPLTADDKTDADADNTGVLRIIRVITRYGVDLDEKWFNPRDVVHIFSRATGVTEDGQWKIHASALATDKTYVDVLIEDQNAGSDAPYAIAPEAGVVVSGRNAVNDFESWCHNTPNIDGRKMVPFWFQTSRRSRCVDAQYKEWFARLKTSGVNAAFDMFGDLDLAKRNKQDELLDQKKWVNDFFLNKPLQYQTLADWKSLDDIVTPVGIRLDPGTGGRVVTKRARFIGVKEQLRRCDRYRDLANQPLNLLELFDELYRIKRARETNGGTTTSIDIYTNSAYAVYFQQAMIKYYKDFWLDQVRINITPGQNEQLGMAWDSYKLIYPAGLTINIITHPHFDDWYSANNTESQGSVGNMMLILDLGKGGIYWSQLASNRKTHKTGDLEALAKIDIDYKCVMESFVDEVTMTSDTGTVIVECPINSLWVEGIAMSPLVTSGQTANSSTSNLY